MIKAILFFLESEIFSSASVIAGTDLLNIPSSIVKNGILTTLTYFQL